MTYGTNGTASRYYVGPLPTAGQWVRLEVPASAIGLEGQSLTGMSFSVYNGRVTWDYPASRRAPRRLRPLTRPRRLFHSVRPRAARPFSGSSVTVSATASDNVGVAGVQFKTRWRQSWRRRHGVPLQHDVEFHDRDQRLAHAHRCRA